MNWARALFRSLPYGLGARLSKLAVLTILLVGSTAQARAEIVIAALGDSLTQGYGLPEEDGFVPQLERWLHAHGASDARLINAGVSGDTSAGGRARIAWTLADAPDALIVTLGGNDLLRGIDPAATRANLDAILSETAARNLPVLLVAMPAPGNYGPEYKAAFDAIYPELAEKHGSLLYPDFLAPLGDRSAPETLRPFMQEDFLHPNAKGVSIIVEAIGPRVLELIDLAHQSVD